jgi:hypothetical protein
MSTVPNKEFEVRFQTVENDFEKEIDSLMKGGK